MCKYWAKWIDRAALAFIVGMSVTGAVNAQTPEAVPVQDCRTSFVDRVTLSCERTGVIAEVPDEGTILSAGQIVVRLNDNVPRATLAAAQGRALVSEVEIGVAEKTAMAAALEHDAALEANRFTRPDNPSFPKTHIDRLRLNAEAASLQVEQRRREKNVNELSAAQAQAELEAFWIRSSFGGLVTKVLKRRGEGVQQSESIIEVVNTDRLRVEGYVSVENSTRIEVGMPVKVTFQMAGGEKPMSREFSGKLGFVDVSIQPLSQKVRVWAEIDNTSKWLREGLTADMVILLETPPQLSPEKSK